MRFTLFASTVLTLCTALSAHAKNAPSCDVQMHDTDSDGKAQIDRTKKNQDNAALAKVINALFEKDGKKPALYFVFPAKAGTADEIVPFVIPTKDDAGRFDLPKDLALRLSTSGPVKMLNRTDHREEGFASPQRFPSLYFMPRPVSRLNGTKVKTDFDGNLVTHVGPECSVVDLKGIETLSVLYGGLTHYADGIVRYNEQIRAGNSLKPRDQKIYEEDIKILNHRLGVSARRTPAGTDSPTYADEQDVKVENRKMKNLSVETTPRTKSPSKTETSGSTQP